MAGEHSGRPAPSTCHLRNINAELGVTARAELAVLPLD